MKKFLIASLTAFLLLTHPTLVRSALPVTDAIALLEQDDADGKPVYECTTFSTVSQGEIVWVTAGHCVMNETTGAVIMDGYKIGGVPAQFVAANIPSDIAMLKGGPSRSRLNLATKMVKTGDTLSIYGYPLFFNELLLRQGIVSHPSFKHEQWAKGMMIVQLPTAQGDSGDPVLNTKDELVGMLTGGFCRLDNPFGAPIAYSGFCAESVGVSQETLTTFITSRK